MSGQSIKGLNTRKFIKVLIVTDYILLSDGLERILKNVQDIVLVGKTTSVTEAFKAVKNLTPDVIIMDKAMFEMKDQKLFDYIKDNQVPIKVLLLAEKSGEDAASQLLTRGVSGILSRCTLIPDIIKAIQKVNSGEIWFGRGILSMLVSSKYNSSETVTEKLSCREEDVVTLIAQGYRNKDIAKKLCISEKTVKSHLTSVFKRMGVNNRLQVALQFLSHTQQGIRLKS